MKTIKTILMGLVLAFGSSALATEEYATPAVGGYDVVSYFSGTQPVRGSGMHAATHEGQTYLFANKDNKKAFEKNPGQYLPQYGGWCAFGAALGKKFHVDPLAFAVVNGKLYLNLDKSIQEKWLAKQASMISDADKKWDSIKAKPASSL